MFPPRSGWGFYNCNMRFIKITDYKNYREFLRDYYDKRKAEDPKFSYRFFAQKAGINSSGLYSNLVSGLKNLTENSALKFADALELNEREKKYFDLMRIWTHSQSDAHRTQIESEMSIYWPRASRRYHQMQKKFFSKWYYSVILQLLHVLNVKANYRSLVDLLRLPLSEDEMKEAIELLSELDMIAIDAEGFWRPTHPTGIGGKEVGIDVIRNFQKVMMRQGEWALDHVEPDERHIVSNTLSATSTSIHKIKEKIHKLQKEIQEVVQSEGKADEVYQLNIQFFPFTRNSGKSR